MIDRQNTINYITYLLKFEKIKLARKDLKNLERICLTQKISLLENIISSIKQMPEVNFKSKLNNKEFIIENIDDNKLRKNSNKNIVEQYDMNNNFIKEYHNPTDAHNETGIKLSGIINTIAKRQTNAGGFIWKYKFKRKDDV